MIIELLAILIMAIGNNTERTYRRILLRQNFYCAANTGASYINVTKQIAAAGNQNFSGNINAFTISFWVKITREMDMVASYPFMSVLVPHLALNSNFSISKNLNDVNKYDLLLNGTVVFPQLFIVSAGMLSISSQIEWSPVHGFYWESIIISISTLASQYTLLVSTSAGSYMISFRAPSFTANDVFILLGTNTNIDSVCLEEFVISGMYLYDIYYSNQIDHDNIRMGAPSYVYAIYKPFYGSQYEFVWYNLIGEGLPYISMIMLNHITKNDCFIRNEAVQNFNFGNVEVLAEFPLFIPQSNVDQSYTVTITYDMVMDWALINSIGAGSCQPHTMQLYRRYNGAIQYPINLQFSITSGPSCLIQFSSEPPGFNPSISPTPRTSKSLALEDTITIQCVHHVLYGDTKRITFISQTLNGGTIFTANTIELMQYFNPHQMTNSIVSSDLFYLISIYEIVITLGGTLNIEPGQNPSVSLLSPEPVAIACSTQRKILRNRSDNNLVMDFGTCNPDMEFGMNCPSIQGCMFCNNTECINCFPGYMLENRLCTDCRVHGAGNEIWDPLTKTCLPSAGAWDFNQPLALQLTLFGSFHPEILIIKMNFTCSNDSVYCPGSYSQMTYYLNAYLLNQTSISFYQAGSLIPSVFSAFQNIANSLQNGQVLATYAVLPVASIPNSSSNFVTYFPCNMIDLYMDNIPYSFHNACSDCSVGGRLVDSIIGCYHYPLNCYMMDFSIQFCLIAESNYTIIDGTTVPDTNKPENISINYTAWDLTNIPSYSLNDIDAIANSSATPVNQTPTYVTVFNGNNQYTVATMNLSVGFDPGRTTVNRQNTGPITTSCELINPNCSVCMSSTCLECQRGFMLSLNVCIPVMCHEDNCIYCPLLHYCQLCKLGYELINNTCVLIQELLDSNIRTRKQDRLKTQCPDNCFTCDDKGKCGRCTGKYILDQEANKCITPKITIEQVSINSNEITQELDETVNVESYYNSPPSNCTYCPVCQYQTTFFCQKCDICFMVCQCFTTADSKSRGFMVTCPNVIFDEDSIKNSQPLFGKTAYKLSVSTSNNSVLLVTPHGMARDNITFQIRPGFIKKSFHCTLTKPKTIYYELPKPLIILASDRRRKVVNTIHIARNAGLFIVQFISIGIEKIIVAFLQMNVIFTYIGLLNLPIYGFYDLFLTLSTDDEPSRKDMGYFLDLDSQSSYFTLNSKYRAYFFVNQQTILINFGAICGYFVLVFLFNNCLIILKRRKANPKWVYSIRWLRSIVRSGYMAIVGGNLVIVTPLCIFFSHAMGEMDNFGSVINFQFATFVLVASPMILKFNQIVEFQENGQRVGNFQSNQLRIIDPAILWLKISNLFEEIITAVFFVVFFQFQFQQTIAIYISMCFCVITGLVISWMVFIHFRVIGMLKLFQFMCLFGFLRLSLELLHQNYKPSNFTAFNTYFIMSHCAAQLSFIIGLKYQRDDAKKYKDRKKLKQLHHEKQQQLKQQEEELMRELDRERAIARKKAFKIRRRREAYLRRKNIKMFNNRIIRHPVILPDVVIMGEP